MGMGLNITGRGIEAPDTEAVREAVAGVFSKAFTEDGQPPLDTDSSTPAGQLIDGLTAEVEAKNAELLFLASQLNPKVAEGRWQDALGYLYFIRRKRNEPTVVVCQVTGRNGTIVPYGAQARTADGVTLMCNRVATIEDGHAETTFRTADTGPTQVPAGAVTQIVTTVPGWDTITNAEAGVTGRDIETRADFEARRAGSVSANAQGSVGALYGALYDINGQAGVLDVKVLENLGREPQEQFGVTVPGHGVTICIFGGEDKDIAKVIYEKKDAGCDTGGNAVITHVAEDFYDATYQYRILRPQPVGFWVKVEIKRSEALTPTVIAKIKEAVLSDFLGENDHTGQPRLGLASDAYASRFYHAIAAVSDVQNLLRVRVALGDDPQEGDWREMLTIRGDQEPVMAGDQVIVEAVA